MTREVRGECNIIGGKQLDLVARRSSPGALAKSRIRSRYHYRPNCEDICPDGYWVPPPQLDPTTYNSPTTPVGLGSRLRRHHGIERSNVTGRVAGPRESSGRRRTVGEGGPTRRRTMKQYHYHPDDVHTAFLIGIQPCNFCRRRKLPYPERRWSSSLHHYEAVRLFSELLKQRTRRYCDIGRNPCGLLLIASQKQYSFLCSQTSHTAIRSRLD